MPVLAVPWLPICVQTLFFSATNRIWRASHTVWVNGFWQYT